MKIVSYISKIIKRQPYVLNVDELHQNISMCKPHTCMMYDTNEKKFKTIIVFAICDYQLSCLSTFIIFITSTF